MTSNHKKRLYIGKRRQNKKERRNGDYYFILRASALLKGTFIASAKDENSPRNLGESLNGIVKRLYICIVRRLRARKTAMHVSVE